MKSFKKKWLQKSITLGLLSGMCCIGVNAYAEDLSDNTVPVNEKYVVEESAAEEDVLYPLTGSYGVAKPSKVDTAGSFRPLYAPLSDPGPKTEVLDFTESSGGGGTFARDVGKGNIVILYRHETNRPEDPNTGLNVRGIPVLFYKADPNTTVTVRTDNTGLDTTSTKAADQNLVSGTLNNLAKKLFYRAYKDGERNLKGKVEIAEGLTAQSASLKIGDITFRSLDGWGQYLYTPAEESARFETAILGSADRDRAYVEAGILKDGVYSFTKPETTIVIDGTADPVEGKRDLVVSGPSIFSAAISGSLPRYDEAGNVITYDTNTAVSSNVKLDLHGNKLNVLAKYDNASAQTGIGAFSAVNKLGTAGLVEIDNAGAMKVDVTGSGKTAALLAEGGGKLVIHNGGENPESKILKLRGNAKQKEAGAGIKAMASRSSGLSSENYQAEITIDGLVDVVADGKASADGYSSNEAVSAHGSDINIGGGTIKALNGAWAAIRAYSDMLSPNYGVVNVNTANREYMIETGTDVGCGFQYER